MVVMWEDVNNFMHNLLLTKDPVKVVDEGGFVNSRAEYRDTYWSRVKKLAPLKEMNPVEYYLGVFESHYLALGTIDDEELFDDFKESMEYIASHRDPEYVRLATLLYENTQSEHPDPKILLHEFQRILKPLLERLRTKNEIGGGAA